MCGDATEDNGNSVSDTIKLFKEVTTEATAILMSAQTTKENDLPMMRDRLSSLCCKHGKIRHSREAEDDGSNTAIEIFERLTQNFANRQSSLDTSLHELSEYKDALASLPRLPTTLCTSSAEAYRAFTKTIDDNIEKRQKLLSVCAATRIKLQRVIDRFQPSQSLKAAAKACVAALQECKASLKMREEQVLKTRLAEYDKMLISDCA